VRRVGPCLSMVVALAVLATTPIEATAQFGLFSRSQPASPAPAGGTSPATGNIAAPDGNVLRPPGEIPGLPPSAIAPLPGGSSPPPAGSSPPPAGSSPPPAGSPTARGPAANIPGAAPASALSILPSTLALSARFGRDAPTIASGLHWRIFSERPDNAGVFKLMREDRTASPMIQLPAGGYIVHAAFGLATAVKRVTVRDENTTREVFDIPAGGVRFEGRVADARIPAAQITFDVYQGGQFEGGDRRPIASEVPTGDLVLLPEGTYHVVSNYGDGNAVIRSDFRVQAGKLTDARINHRAALITLKLVGEKGGEALANTAWSVLTPGGDVIKESIGAFPTVVLAEGEYVVIARHEGKVFNREFKVEPGFDREIELLAR
jgi:hypothetical protein